MVEFSGIYGADQRCRIYVLQLYLLKLHTRLLWYFKWKMYFKDKQLFQILKSSTK